MKKKLILFDVDGTLYDNANKEIPTSTIEALRALKQQGHELAVATGRAYYMLYSIDAIHDLIDHYILINGQHIIANGKTIYEDVVPFPLLQQLVKSMDQRKITYGFQSSETEALNHLNPEVIHSFEQLNLNLPKEDPLFHLYHDVFQMWCFCNPEQALELQAENPDFTFVKWMHVGYDVVKTGNSKGKGLHQLKDHLGYDIEDVVAFGDGDNDIEMCQEAGLSIAMGNGTNRLKEVADEVTEPVNQHGIANALKRHHLI